MDALRGSLSNAESFGRGFAVAPVGLLGDIEGLLRKGVNFSFGRGGVNVGETPVLPTTEGLLSSIPRMTPRRMETAGIEQIGSAANPRGPINLGRAVAELPSNVVRAGKEFLETTAQPMRIIDLNKRIYKPELTMEEMLKVKDIPTVDRVKQSIDLVGEDKFKKMVDAQYKKYKPTDQDQEAMLVESVTLDILGKAQRSPVEYPLAPAGTRYEEFAGNLTYMTPDEFLQKVRPLKLDDESLDNIAALKRHIESGGKLDPLHIYSTGKEDGRHRAYLAKELGIEKVPVALHEQPIQGLLD